MKVALPLPLPSSRTSVRLSPRTTGGALCVAARSYPYQQPRPSRPGTTTATEHGDCHRARPLAIHNYVRSISSMPPVRMVRSFAMVAWRVAVCRGERREWHT